MSVKFSAIFFPPQTSFFRRFKCYVYILEDVELRLFVCCIHPTAIVNLTDFRFIEFIDNIQMA